MRAACALGLAALLAAAPLPGQVGAPDRDQSRYWELPASAVVPARTVVRSETLSLTRPGRVFVQSDGSVAPVSWPSSARPWLYVAIDGVPVSNTSLIDWNKSIAPQVHAYNVVGSASLSAGTHVVELVADTRGGSFALRARSNLCVFVNPADKVVQVQLGQDSRTLESPLSGGFGAERCSWGRLAHHPLMRLPMPDPELPIFAFASARAFRVQGWGDMMLGLFPEDESSANETQVEFQATYAVEDLWIAAEYQAPVYCQGVWRGTAPSEFDPTLTLGVTGYPPSTQTLTFRIGGEATMVALYGGLQVSGWAANTAGPICDPICAGGTGAGCAPVATRVTISRATFTVPPGHDGRILFAAKARNQGNARDGASVTTMQIVLDGNDVGSLAEQGLAGWLGGWDSCLSQRTMCASYLAAGPGALSPGTHVVEVVVTVLPSANPSTTTKLSIWDDDPFLVWFD